MDKINELLLKTHGSITNSNLTESQKKEAIKLLLEVEKIVNRENQEM